MPLRVSIILPTFNRAHLIAETIESILAQTRQPDEIIVVDDGSTDGTAGVLARFDALTVIRIKNGGKAAALNKALSLVSGDLIWIVDDDDLLLPDACALLAAPLETDAELDFCAGRHLDFEVDSKGARQIRDPGYMRESASDEIFPDLLEGCHIFQPGLLVRRRVYEEVGPFNTDLVRSQDYEMVLRIARRRRGKQLKETVFLHREHSGLRGSASTQFAASNNADKWAAYNRIIFTNLLSDLPDRDMLAKSQLDACPVELQARTARIKRGCVLARQRMWPEAVSAWQDAARMHPSELTDFERDMLARSPNSTLGAPELFLSPEVRAGFRALTRMSAPGPEIAKLVKRAGRWHVKAAIKSRDWPVVLNGLRLLLGR